jgi:hypothetical protein
MSVYSTHGAIRKLPVPMQTGVVDRAQTTFAAANDPYSCVAGVVRRSVVSRFESSLFAYTERLARREPSRFEKGQG